MRLAPQSALFGNSIAGNLQNDTYTSTGDPAGAQTRFFDAENRMKSARNLSGQNAIYTYDADGRRVRRNSAGQEIWQIYGIDAELLAEYAANSSPASPQKEYGYRSGELLVTAEAATTVPPTTNLALNQTATQSSEGFGGVASRAVDGNTNGDWAAGSSSHTLLNAQAWWQVDLGAVQTIQSIKVWNLTSCCAERMSNFYVLVSDSAFTSTDLQQTLSQPGVSGYYTAGAAGRPTSVAANGTGRYVRVQLTGANYLHIPEVEVWGTQGQATAGGVSWLVSDHLGTPRMVIDQTGGLSGVKRRDYLPFGEEISAGSGGRTMAQGYAVDDLRQKFTSYERDAETGSDFARARYYSNPQGRFTSIDPLLVSATMVNPQTWNRYTYVLNNPLRLVDPSGMRTCWDASCSGSEDEASQTQAELAYEGRLQHQYNAIAANRALKRGDWDAFTGLMLADLTLEIEGNTSQASQTPAQQQQREPCDLGFDPTQDRIPGRLPNGISVTSADVFITARTVFAEASGDTGGNATEEQLAVTSVIFNRLNSPAFGSPQSLTAVVRAPGQFQAVTGGPRYTQKFDSSGPGAYQNLSPADCADLKAAFLAVSIVGLGGPTHPFTAFRSGTRGRGAVIGGSRFGYPETFNPPRRRR